MPALFLCGGISVRGCLQGEKTHDATDQQASHKSNCAPDQGQNGHEPWLGVEKPINECPGFHDRSLFAHDGGDHAPEFDFNGLSELLKGHFAPLSSAHTGLDDPAIFGCHYPNRLLDRFSIGRFAGAGKD